MALRKIALALWLPAAIMAIWQISASAGWLDPLFFPAPLTLLGTATAMAKDGDLLLQTRYTLGHVFIGFLPGSAAGIACGLLMGAIPALEDSFEPAISAIYSTPNLTLLPMLMMFFGVSDTAGIILIATGCFLLLAVHALHAVRGVERCYVEMAMNYGANRLDVIRKVYFPACLPGVFTGLRLALGRALVIAVSVEMVSASHGIGGMIWIAWQTLSIERLYVGILTAAVLGTAFALVLRRFQSWLIRWQ